MADIVNAVKQLTPVGAASNISKAADAISNISNKTPQAPEPPKENPGYTERLTGEKAAIGAATGAQNVDNSGLEILKAGEQ